MLSCVVGVSCVGVCKARIIKLTIALSSMTLMDRTLEQRHLRCGSAMKLKEWHLRYGSATTLQK
eukprot:scaffold232649_cov22-Tisochrysis_lutea.AAC.1